MNKKNKSNKKSDKENILSKDFLNRQKIRQNKHIWVWIIFLPPIGIYKAYKYKAFKNYIILFFILLFSLVAFLSLDVIIYPDRVIDNNVKKIIEEVSDSVDIGSYRNGSRIGSLNNKYIIYNVVTTNGIYDFYLNGKSGENVIAINQISPKRELILDNDFDIKDKDLYAELLRFFNEKENKDTYGEVLEVISSLDETQTVKTTKGNYRFTILYEQVTSIEKEVDEVYQSVYNKEPILTLPDNIKKILKKREKTLGKIANVISYKVTDKSIEYVILMHNENYYKIEVLDDGSVIIYDGDLNLED